MGYLLPFDRSVQLGQQFGARPGMSPNPPGGHNGDDWLTVIGTPVRAAGDGEVIFAGQFDDTYADNFGWNLHYGGNMVVLNMDGDTAPYFEYGHLSRILVKAGQRVRRGDIIALTGNTDGGTGISTGPHCHVGCLPYNFDLSSNTYGRVNPRLYMTDYPDAGSLSYAGETITPLSEEDDMPSPADLWSHPLDLDGQSFTAGDILVYARKNAADAKDEAKAAKYNSETAAIAAQQAPALAVQTLLATKLPTPDGSAEYTIADYITYGWWYAMQAKDKPTGAVMDPAAIADAVQVSAAEVASRLELTVKESK